MGGHIELQLWFPVKFLQKKEKTSMRELERGQAREGRERGGKGIGGRQEKGAFEEVEEKLSCWQYYRAGR